MPHHGLAAVARGVERRVPESGQRRGHTRRIHSVPRPARGRIGGAVPHLLAERHQQAMWRFARRGQRRRLRRAPWGSRRGGRAGSRSILRRQGSAVPRNLLDLDPCAERFELARVAVGRGLIDVRLHAEPAAAHQRIDFVRGEAISLRHRIRDPPRGVGCRPGDTLDVDVKHSPLSHGGDLPRMQEVAAGHWHSYRET